MVEIKRSSFTLYTLHAIILSKMSRPHSMRGQQYAATTESIDLKVHKIEIFFGFDFEICIISLLVTSKK
jgi:hypothetical protein